MIGSTHRNDYCLGIIGKMGKMAPATKKVFCRSNLPPSGGRWVVVALGLAALAKLVKPQPAHAQVPVYTDFTALGEIARSASHGLFYLVGISALLSLTMGAYQYIMAGGDPKELDAAKKSITWAIIGTFIGVATWTFVKIVWGDILGAPGILHFVVPGP